MAILDLAKVNDLFPKILEKTVRNQRYQSRYKREIDAAAEKIAYNNPLGTNTPYVTAENATLFSVAEGGQILNGAPVEYTQGTVDIRKMWKSAGFTGDVERQLDSKVAEIATTKPELAGNFDELNRLAHNRIVRDLVFSTLNLYAHHENYFALQGTSKSTVAVVTDVSDIANGNVGFAWATTSQGNRLFEKNQRIQFYDSGSTNQRVAGMSTDAGVKYSEIDVKPDHRASTNSAGVTHFTNLPSDLAVGDTAHFQNSYGALPVGFVNYIDDTGDFKGITRSVDYERFASVMDRRSGSPVLTPLILHENESFLEGKVGYGIPFVCKIVINKAQRFNYTAQLYNTNSGYQFTRWVDTQKNGGAINRYDPSVATSEEALMFNNKEMIFDEHTPPAEVFFVNFASWRKVVRTEVRPYAFDSGSYIINPIDQYGVRLEQKMFTIFSEYNWDCVNPITNSRITGLAFTPAHVRQP